MPAVKVPLCVPSIGEEEISEVSAVLRSGWLAHGPKNAEFEKLFSEYTEVKHAIAMNSCTSALQVSIQALGLKGEIIVPSFTFVASANAIVTAGCTPRFADIDYGTCNVSPQAVEKAIGKKTVAIMPVHFAGQACAMDEIMEMAETHGLAVIEDSAEAIGAECSCKKTGSFGSAGCFSFYPTKNITTGEGGMLTTNNDGVAEKAKALKAHGIVSTAFERERKERPWLRQAEVAGYNFRLCDVLAAIGVAQMKKVDRMNDERRAIAKKYDRAFAGIDALDLPVEAEKCRHVYQMYTVKVGKQIDRQAFVGKLRESGVQASVHFDPPVHLQPYYRNAGWKKSELRVTESVAEKIVTLPIYAGMGREQSDCVVSAVENALKA